MVTSFSQLVLVIYDVIIVLREPEGAIPRFCALEVDLLGIIRIQVAGRGLLSLALNQMERTRVDGTTTVKKLPNEKSMLLKYLAGSSRSTILLDSMILTLVMDDIDEMLLLEILLSLAVTIKKYAGVDGITALTACPNERPIMQRCGLTGINLKRFC